MHKKMVVKELTLPLSESRRITVELRAECSYDPSHGADADGNRGMPVWFIDDVTWDLPDTDDDGNALTDREKKMVDGLLNLSVDDIEWE